MLRKYQVGHSDCTLPLSQRTNLCLSDDLQKLEFATASLDAPDPFACSLEVPVSVRRAIECAHLYSAVVSPMLVMLLCSQVVCGKK